VIGILRDSLQRRFHTESTEVGFRTVISVGRSWDSLSIIEDGA
jgi:hypothetical protein